jgi:hypothetical protein
MLYILASKCCFLVNIINSKLTLNTYNYGCSQFDLIECFGSRNNLYCRYPRTKIEPRIPTHTHTSAFSSRFSAIRLVQTKETGTSRYFIVINFKLICNYIQALLPIFHDYKGIKRYKYARLAI